MIMLDYFRYLRFWLQLMCLIEYIESNITMNIEP